jgi:Capsule polysaccharide biosynthesis protein
MRFLFTTLQTYESDFYGRVGAELERRGHDVSHMTVSRRAAKELRAKGIDARCIHDVINALPPADTGVEAARIETEYGLPTIRDAYRGDRPSEGKPEEWSVERAVAYFRAVEDVLDDVRPDVLVPEVGSEVVRIAMHRVGVARGIPVLFLLLTIFPRPLRLYVNTLDAPIVEPAELRELTPDEESELDAFVREFTARAEPIRKHRRMPLVPRRIPTLLGHFERKLRDDRDNEYTRPFRLLVQNVHERLRTHSSRLLYQQRRPGRPFVYFPLHVTDDYKIKTVIPHCIDQASLVEQVADALPSGYDLVVKEHPMSIGRNPLSFLRRLRRRANVRLVHPYANSHELIREAEAVVVISSTVGLEALLYEKPVLTLGRPFYSGYGVTVDVESFREIREAVPAVLRFRPERDLLRRFLHAAMRRCSAGVPVLVDRSQENAVALAGSIERSAERTLAERARPVPVS